MTNNDILRRLRYTFDLADTKIVAIFKLVEAEVDAADITAWLKKDDDPWFKSCSDQKMATFLNGFIVFRRGKKDGPLPVAEKQLDNNIVLRKLKIAMDFKSDDIQTVLQSAGLSISDHELSALFRKKGHKHYRECKDQILRNFLEGLRLKYRP
ncbi:DUF1456 family protein [Oceanicoccus sagamiensis]|uniref:Cytoplasmic protein n=1 Tax=Oceanicoccus sagamiensis TaxID=716816 RepID=A0A1X9NCL2_9GAMM|nr:DUF1456 family protein [Oceanicoccus sagamiensis]ARN75770.1 hypothetical protein BST96_17640 [Oceanicoccus sagamiensis]